MNTSRILPTLPVVVAVAVLAALSAAGGYWFARKGGSAMRSGAAAASGTPEATNARKALYWYDPMVPNQHFDKPGRSPFMDMQLIARYADERDEDNGVRIDPRITQNLGLRLTRVQRGVLSQPVNAVGSVTFDQRHIAIVQSRTSGFVARTYARAPGELLRKGEPLVDLLVPEWAGAQTEFLALLRNGDPGLIDAARQRLVLLGMPADLVAAVERSKKQQQTLTVRSPFAGVIETLDVREGMTVATGNTLARISGLDSVWLEAAVPEAQGALTSMGKSVEARLTAFPAERFKGRVIAVLPEASSETRTLRVRIELANRSGRLKPGMFAQVNLETGSRTPTLYVPSEAVIHTGRRSVVIVAGDHGRFVPTEVRTGADVGDKTVVLEGLNEGESVVASGQFLIDSEASLRGVLARLGAAREPGEAP
jgi:Cu(I)/Ag(I) efflux system membrane fusion protein